MRYFEEMQNKFGFGDGGSEPDGARVYRKVYLRFINALAAEHRSKFRIIAWDRPGMHNGCMVIEVSRAYFESLNEEQRYLTGPDEYPPESEKPEKSDEQLGQAIADAGEMDLDQYIGVEVVTDETAAEEALAALSRGPN